MSDPQTTAVLLLSVCLAAALAVLIRQVLIRRRLEQQHAAELQRRETELQRRDSHVQQLTHLLETSESEVRHLARARVPALVAGMWEDRPNELPGVLHQELAGTRFASELDAVLTALAEMPEQAAQRAEDAARAAVSTTARSMAALVQEVQAAILAMLGRHDDPKVLEDANVIDHAASQLGRRVQVILVLAGSWPGRQRDDSPLLDVVRGAVSRIRDYNRVKVTGDPSVLVGSRAVEAVILSLAELLDNAARHSNPTTDVQVSFITGHNGVSVVVDDAGIGFTPDERERTAELLSGQRPVLLTQMSTRPQFGASVAGVLADRYGFRISVDQESVYGGVRAVVYLPNELLADASGHTIQSTAPRPGADEPSVAEELPERPAPPALTEPSEPSEPSGFSESSAPQPPMRPDGLPQRRRRARHAAQEQPRRPAMQPPSDPSGVLGAFTRGRRAAQSGDSGSTSLPGERNDTE